jgi:Cu(I)/Ag(I) efflux system membrane fusion protein
MSEINDKKQAADAPDTEGQARDAEPSGAAGEAAGGDVTQRAATSPPPPQGPALKKIAVVSATVLVSLWIGTVWGGRFASGTGRMWGALTGGGQPHETSQASVGEDGHVHGGGGSAQPANTQYYTCGMHPWIILPKPGNCPVCTMALTPIDPAKFTGEVSIDPSMVQNIGVRIDPVRTGPLVKTIRTVGTIDYDETRVRDVNIKVSGWIEKLHVDYLGSEVKQGQPLFDLYSPELYAAQEEYLLAWRNRDKIGADFVPDAAKGARDLLEAVRTKLEYYDITDAQTQALQERGEPVKAMTLLSPHTGVVTAKHANEGMRVNPGMQVYRIADLSKVWVMVTLYEYQLPFVSVGQRAVMSLPYVPGQTFEGRVLYIYPYLEKQTRQVTVRLEFDNPTSLLKPGMYVNVELKSTLSREATLVSRSAVIDTGERQVAFASLGEGRFEPRDVQIGVETDDGMVQVLSGLKPGEMVVVSGQFLIDSEAKIRDAMAKMVRGNLASEQKVMVAVEGVSELSSVSPAVAGLLGDAFDAYFLIGNALAHDTVLGIREPARELAEILDTLLKIELKEDPHFWHKHTEAATILGSALEMMGVDDLETTRLLYAKLSVAFIELAKATGVPPAYGKHVQVLHCPMYHEGQGGGAWLAPMGEVRNPFFGRTMPGCFDKRVALPVTGGQTAIQAPAAQPATTQPNATQPASPASMASPHAPPTAGPGLPLSTEEGE